MKKIVLSLTPDVVLDLLAFMHKWLAIIGLVDKPKPVVKETEPFEVSEEDIEGEIDSLFQLADENAMPTGDDVMWYPTLDDEDDMDQATNDVNDRLAKGYHDYLHVHLADSRVEAIKMTRQVTGWELPEAKLFIDTVEKLAA